MSRSFGRFTAALTVAFLVVGTAAAQRAYYSDCFEGCGIARVDFDGTALGFLQLGNSGTGTALDVDHVGRKLYYAGTVPDPMSPAGMVANLSRANLNGSDIEILVDPAVPIAIAVDPDGAKVYWSEGDPIRILRADLDGSNVQVIVTGYGRAHDLDVDPPGGRIYWLQGPSSGTDDRVLRARLDGSNVEVLLSTDDGVASPSAVAVDVVGRRLYWGDDGVIQRSKLDGSNVETVITDNVLPPGGYLYPTGIDVVADKIFFNSGNIYTANKDGTDVWPLLVFDGWGGPVRLAVGVSPSFVVPAVSTVGATVTIALLLVAATVFLLRRRRLEP